MGVESGIVGATALGGNSGKTSLPSMVPKPSAMRPGIFARADETQASRPGDIPTGKLNRGNYVFK